MHSPSLTVLQSKLAVFLKALLWGFFGGRSMGCILQEVTVGPSGLGISDSRARCATVGGQTNRFYSGLGYNTADVTGLRCSAHPISKI